MVEIKLAMGLHQEREHKKPWIGDSLVYDEASPDLGGYVHSHSKIILGLEKP